jgi:hypothetical protein
MFTPNNRSRLLASLAAVVLFSIPGPQAWALDPGQPPSGNFDLSNWNLQWYQCSGGGESSGSPIGVNNHAYFYTGPDGAMTFWCPDGGGCTSSTNTPHQRTELENKTLWHITDSTEHTLTGSCKVLQQPSNGSLIIGQIHGTSPSHGSELLKFRWMSGSIVAGIKTSVGATESYNTIISGVSIGDTINYILDANNHVVTATVNINGGSSHSFKYTPDSSWNSDPLYFKAGDYNQDTGSSTTDGGRVAFYVLLVTTGGSGPTPVANPTFSPGSGSYSSAQTVTIASATSGASIRYTTDGSTPSETTGTIYSGPVLVNSNETLHAIAYKSGMTDSNVTSATYTIGTPPPPQVATPAFSPGGGSYTSSQTVTISDTTGASSIRYTTDGSTPSETAGTLYSGSFSISSTETLKAIAYESGFTDSTVASATYTIGTSPPPQVATPTFSPGGGNYASAQTVLINDSTNGATIRYTTDGSTPSETNGTVYSVSISISSTTTLKTIAYMSGSTDSNVASATYTIGGSSCVTATVGGSWQDAASVLETGTFTATFDATPSASPTNAVVGLSKGAQAAYAGFACIARFNNSGIIDAYNNTGYVSTTIHYSAGVTYHFRMVVNVSAHTYSVYVTPAGGTELTVGLNYAFRSTQNTVTSLDYWGAFVDVAGSGGAGTLNVCNFAVGGVQPTVSDPQFSLADGTYTSAQSVTISDSTSGASIRYTTDGSTPSETVGTLYSGSVSIAATTTLKAIAYESGYTDSNVASATYTIGGSSCVTATSGGAWQNAALSTSETGTFTATFDATPSASTTNAVVGLSKGAQTAYTGFGCIARFNTSGDIDAYNNTGYVGTTIKYSAGVTYHFRMVVNVPAHTYSVYVTPAGGTELTVGLNYAFRSTQNTVTSLTYWGTFVDVAGSGGAGTLNVCNFAVQ